ncbi:uncharacterized protein LOC117903265 [Drosophila subobscura]|uniref:uncharacterized protein LOC117903265 n=1 Tax=Drosophila subobscura TaxID=7241 RepID=UPI00155B3913|nr:uncharacterized protein LOC117903265 [Drosophila subobscura]
MGRRTEGRRTAAACTLKSIRYQGIHGPDLIAIAPSCRQARTVNREPTATAGHSASQHGPVDSTWATASATGDWPLAKNLPIDLVSELHHKIASSAAIWQQGHINSNAPH